MVSVVEPSVQKAFELEQIEYISPEALVSSFALCPQSLYVRGEENLTKDRIESMIVDLLFPLNNGEKKQAYIHRIVNPIVFFTLT